MKTATDLTHEETGGAVGAATAGQTPQEGIEMNTTIIARDADIHESLRHLIEAPGAFDIRSDFAAPQLLPEGDAHWIDQIEVRREKPDVNAEAKADAARERAEWLAENAEAVSAVQPAWADPDLTWVDLLRIDDDDDPDTDMMEFRRNVGGVAIEQGCAIDDGVMSLMGEPQIRITAVIDDAAVFSRDDAARVGVDMLHATQVLQGGGDIGVGIFDVVGKELGISGADLHTLAHVDKDPENDITMGDLFRMSRYVGMSPSALFNLAQERRASEATVSE